MNEAEEVHLFMGVGARNRGATCDLIPDTLPGVAYVAIDGIAEPIRVRFAHYTDDDIAQLGRPDPVVEGTSSPRSGPGGGGMSVWTGPDPPHDHRRRWPATLPLAAAGLCSAAAAPGPGPAHRHRGRGRDPVRLHPRNGLPAVCAQGSGAADAAMRRRLAPHHRTRPHRPTTERPRTDDQDQDDDEDDRG